VRLIDDVPAAIAAASRAWRLGIEAASLLDMSPGAVAALLFWLEQKGRAR